MRRRRNAGGALIKLILSVALIAALFSIPHLLTSLSEGFADSLTPRFEESFPFGGERAIVVRHVDGDTLLLRAADGGFQLLPPQETK